MPVVNELHIHVKSERVPATVLNACIGKGEEYPTPLLDALKDLVEKNGVGTVDMEFQCVDGYVSEASDEFVMCSALSLRVDDFDAAEARVAKLADGTDLAGALTFHRNGSWEQRDGFLEQNGNAAPYKSIEVYYDIDDIPPGYPDALDFRNEAMDLIEAALMAAEAGEWAGAEVGMGEVNFGFEVTDFVHAEKLVRATVKGTPFEGIREITRFEQ